MLPFLKTSIRILIAGLLLTSAGCYGSFNLTKKVYKWNGTFGDKWVNELGFLALNIVPVYGIAAAMDAAILNSIEFWTGKNPVITSIAMPDRGAAVSTAPDKNGMTLTSKEGLTVTIVLTEDGAEVRDGDGRPLARSVRTADGVATFAPDGSKLGSMSDDQIAAFVLQDTPAMHKPH